MFVPLDCLGTFKGQAFQFECSEAAFKQWDLWRGMALNLGKCTSRTSKENITNTVSLSLSDSLFISSGECSHFSPFRGCTVLPFASPQFGWDTTDVSKGSLLVVFIWGLRTSSRPCFCVSKMLVRGKLLEFTYCWWLCVLVSAVSWVGKEVSLFSTFPQIGSYMSFSAFLKGVVDRASQHGQNYL